MQLKIMKVRKETFGKNYSQVHDAFAKTHENEVTAAGLGGDVTVSKWGYPDTGSNIYSDCLSYKDWIKIMNAQRCHEHIVDHLAITYTASFISALVFINLLWLQWAVSCFEDINILRII